MLYHIIKKLTNGQYTIAAAFRTREETEEKFNEMSKNLKKGETLEVLEQDDADDQQD